MSSGHISGLKRLCESETERTSCRKKARLNSSPTTDTDQGREMGGSAGSSEQPAQPVKKKRGPKKKPLTPQRVAKLKIFCSPRRLASKRWYLWLGSKPSFMTTPDCLKSCRRFILRGREMGPVRRMASHELRRANANNRERSRMHGLNNALETLREYIPVNSESQKLSKIETLRLASNYIGVLGVILESETKPDTLMFGKILSRGLSQNTTNMIAAELKLPPRALAPYKQPAHHFETIAGFAEFDQFSMQCLSPTHAQTTVPSLSCEYQAYPSPSALSWPQATHDGYSSGINTSPQPQQLSTCCVEYLPQSGGPTLHSSSSASSMSPQENLSCEYSRVIPSQNIVHVPHPGDITLW